METLQCDICHTNRQGLHKHKKNVKCTLPQHVEQTKYQCIICLTFFKHRQGLHKHKKTVKCTPPPKIDTVRINYTIVEPRPPTVPNNSMKTLNGTIYLLCEREFLNSENPVFKVGKTTEMNKRMSKYPKGSHLLFCMTYDDIHEKEKRVLKMMEDNFTKRTDIGKEYFEGDHKLMINDIFKLFQNSETPLYALK